MTLVLHFLCITQLRRAVVLVGKNLSNEILGFSGVKVYQKKLQVKQCHNFKFKPRKEKAEEKKALHVFRNTMSHLQNFSSASWGVKKKGSERTQTRVKECLSCC